MSARGTDTDTDGDSFCAPQLNLHRCILGKRYTLPNPPIFDLNAEQSAALQTVHAALATGKYETRERLCMVCRASDFDLIAERDRYSLPIGTVVCRTCGLVQTNPVMREVDYVDFYEKYYRAIYVGSRAPDAEFFDWQLQRGQPIVNFLSDFVASARCKVLEIGCGTGGILESFKRVGADVYGYDFDEEYLAYGRAQGLDLRYGGIDAVPADLAPDVIIYVHVFEHLIEPNRDLEIMRKILSPTGVIFIDVPGLYRLEHIYHNDFLRYLQNAHLYHFGLKTLSNLFTGHGFEAVYGDEGVWAVFARSGAQTAPRLVSDYPASRLHIEKTERGRPWFTLRRVSHAWLVEAARKVGLLGVAIKLKRALTRRLPGSVR